MIVAYNNLMLYLYSLLLLLTGNAHTWSIWGYTHTPAACLPAQAPPLPPRARKCAVR